MKYYAVKKGHTTGIFDSWEACQKATKGFTSPDFKAFKNKEDAEAYLNGIDLWGEKVKSDNAGGYAVAFTDGSYNKEKNRYSYGAVLISLDGNKDEVCGYGNNEKYISSNNIIGEIFGVINAMDWAVSNGYEKIKIYHDYEGISKWISGEWKANSDASKMFVNLYKVKFENFLEVVFERVPGHSNVLYNEMADNLAKSALNNRKKLSVKGDSWYSVPFFNEDDFSVLLDLLVESDERINHEELVYNDKSIYKLSLLKDKLNITLYKNGKRTLLIQGKPSYLFQLVTTAIVEFSDENDIEKILGNAYKTTIDPEIIDKAYSPLKNGFPNDYPESSKKLIKQSIINLTYYITSEDYSQYAFPALRALEGHIKYLLTKSDIVVGRNFNQFDKSQTANNEYILTSKISDTSKKADIEKCYNYYKSVRDTHFHFGDIPFDNTKIISKKEDADKIIKDCLDLINTCI